MKVLGLLGGMSWESSAIYYRLINEAVRDRLGGLHSARLVMHSVDFDEIAQLQRTGDWEAAGQVLGQVAASLQAAGAQALVLCTNTMHKVAEQVEAATELPLLHIADATGDRIKRAGFRTVGLLGTRFTMEQDFYKERLASRHGLSVLTPSAQDRDDVHRIIYEELCLGQVRDASREVYQRVIGKLVEQGAEAVILGCTEITLLVVAGDSPVPVFDTTAIHAEAAAAWSLG